MFWKGIRMYAVGTMVHLTLFYITTPRINKLTHFFEQTSNDCLFSLCLFHFSSHIYVFSSSYLSYFRKLLHIAWHGTIVLKSFFLLLYGVPVTKISYNEAPCTEISHEVIINENEKSEEKKQTIKIWYHILLIIWHKGKKESFD